MKLLNTKLKKSIAVILGVILLLVAIIIIFISPIAKYLIQKYDVKYSGREITLDWIYVNPFTGYVHIDDLKVHENKSDSVFFSADGISVNLEMLKLLSKTYEISALTIDKPMAVIDQNKKEFNFDDLIKKFAPKDSLPKPKKAPAHFNLLDVKINDGTFYYYERSIPINYSIKKVNIETEGLRWNVDTILAKYYFESGIGTGDIKGDATVNLKTFDYRFAAVVNKYDLSIMEQYLKDITNYARLRANLDANLQAKGNIKNSQQIDAKGIVSVNDLHFGKNEVEDYLSFKKFTIDIQRLNPLNKKYIFDSIALLQPFFKYERYDHLDNLQNMFGKKGEKVKQGKASSGDVNILFLLSDYVKKLAQNFFSSKFKIGRIAVYKADFHYVDYAINEKFEIAADPLYLIADSIERSEKWVNLNLKTDLKPYGKINVDLSINPKDSSDFNINYHLQKLPVAMFNPYLITYTSFPLDRGTAEIKGNWNVRNGKINSNNHLIILDPRINNKQKRNGAKWIPLKLIMFFVRERGNVIDYEIPIIGDLKDPNFKLKDVIFDVLTNIFVKPATTAYRKEVRTVENEIEKSIVLKWEMKKDQLQPDQEEFVEKINEYLKNHPEATINVSPMPFTEKEKEYILFFEAKKRYYLSINKINEKDLNEDDTLQIDKIPVKDSTFIRYLHSKINEKLLFTVQEKCEKLIGADKVNKIYNKLEAERKKRFLAYFKTDGLENKINFKPTINKIPFNGFSVYKIGYNGEWPEELKEAYAKIMDLNNEKPREKFKKDRESNRKFLRGK